MIWQRVMVKPSGKESEQVRLCNPAGCSAQRSLSRPRNDGCKSRPASHSGKAVALRRCTRRSPERLAGVVEVARREREDRETREVSGQDEVRELWAPGERRWRRGA